MWSTISVQFDSGVKSLTDGFDLVHRVDSEIEHNTRTNGELIGSATGVTIGIFSPDAQYCSNHRQASTCAMFRFSMLELPKPSKYRRRPSRSTYPCFNPCALASAT